MYFPDKCLDRQLFLSVTVLRCASGAIALTGIELRQQSVTVFPKHGHCAAANEKVPSGTSADEVLRVTNGAEHSDA